MRFANRVPLLYMGGACAMTEAMEGVNWKAYGLPQPRGGLPVGPLVIFVHIASVWVPFTSESKEAIAHYPEILKELTFALQECGRRLSVYLSKRKRLAEAERKRSYMEKYIPAPGAGPEGHPGPVGQAEGPGRRRPDPHAGTDAPGRVRRPEDAVFRSQETEVRMGQGSAEVGRRAAPSAWKGSVVGRGVDPAGSRFSTVWKISFHSVEKTACFFHTMEKVFGNFPHNGKQPSAEPEPEAKGEREVYSASALRGERESGANGAAKCFHTVENLN